jgi:hypothetical protein
MINTYNLNIFKTLTLKMNISISVHKYKNVFKDKIFAILKNNNKKK